MGIAMLIGKNLKKLRSGLGLSQREIAKKLHVGYSTYNRWETGDKTPGLDSLVSLATFFHVSLDALCGFDPEALVMPDKFESAVNRLKEMKLYRSQEMDLVKVDVDGVVCNINIKDLPGLVEKADARYEKMLLDANNSMYNTAFALAYKGQYDIYLANYDIGQGVFDGRLFGLRKELNYLGISIEGWITPELLCHILLDLLVLMSAQERKKAWQFAIDAAISSRFLDRDEYEEHKSQWECPVMFSFDDSDFSGEVVPVKDTKGINEFREVVDKILGRREDVRIYAPDKGKQGKKRIIRLA